MPAVSTPSTVLVTGASGFIATWVCRTLLTSGYSVRGTVRTTEKGEYLQNLFSSLDGKFEYVLVSDISQPHAYDDAVKGDLTAVVHIAGPTTFTAENLNDFKALMVDGTVNLLESVRTRSKTVKRFIYMSSAQALLGKPLGHVYTEDDWNDGAVEAVEKNLAETPGQVRYQAGKVLAERAALGYPEKHGGSKALGWDVVSLVPVWTYGPVIHQFSSLDSLNFSTSEFYKHMTEEKDKAEVNGYGSDYVDVRDLADAVAAALKSEAASGQRFILDAGSYTYQNLYDVVNAEPALPGVAIGDPDAPKFSFPGPFCSSEKAVKILGVSFRSLKETARDALASLRERGI